MKKINYGYGGGSGTVLLSMRAKKIFFCHKADDREALLQAYEGRQYYTSRSGASGAGYVFADDLLELPGYRAHITYLSEGYPTEVCGVKIMIPDEGIDYATPAVAIMDGNLIFLYSSEEVIGILGGAIPGEQVKEVTYRYLTCDGEVATFKIPWVGGGCYDRSGRPGNLPYRFEEFASVMGAIPNLYPNPTEVSEEANPSFIKRKMFLSETGVGLARIGYFGLPVEKIEGELFPQEASRNFRSGWTTQGFGSYHFAYKRVGQNGEKVYAILEVVPGQVNEKYSVLGGTPMEYEFLCENVVEWFNHSVEHWVEKMKGELLKKVRSEFLNSARWDESQQIQKVRELLLANPETELFIQDSLDTGNCRPGTEAWMKSFGIKEPMTAQQLLDHKGFEKMLENSRFRAVIIQKFFFSEEPKEEKQEEDQMSSSPRRPRRALNGRRTGTEDDKTPLSLDILD